ncbi:polysaccharide deacetylase family protein [Sulfurospirillum arcachonense]|uniref:polysaccharide deacetylase family protein n=1 Tax=Sulfurospirillum arcachonense TaxID=57666 RepID=UPI000467F000|nr:polysaccharide deacetylase family protein [Sulfurospirillum arcachonense]
MKSFLLLLLTAVTLWANAHIFVYHRFGDSRYPTTNTTIEELQKEFEYFKTNGYKVVPLSLLVKTLKEKKDVPDNWIVLTIDDNFKSFYTNALSVFKKYNYPFSLFVYVQATQDKYKDYLTWEQLREIAKYGSLEFHSYGHPHMTYLSDEELKKDFDKGLALFKKELNLVPKVFTYPYGEYNQRVQKVVRSYGFDAIINQNMGAVSKSSDVYDMDRTALVGKVNLKHYLKYKFLDAKWIEPTIFPKNSMLKSLHVKTNEKEKKGNLYITGHGWLQTTLNDGNFNLKLNKKLTNKRSRIMITVGNKISSKLLIKDKYGIK